MKLNKRQLGATLLIFGILGSIFMVGYTIWENQEVVVATFEDFKRLFLGNTTAEWIQVDIYRRADIFAPRWTLRGDITVGNSATVYLVNDTVLSSKIHLSLAVSINFNNMQNVQYYLHVYASKVGEIGTENFIDNQYPVSSSGYSYTHNYDILTSSTHWLNMKGWTWDFLWFINVSATGTLTNKAYSDTANGKYFRGTIETAQESTSGTVSPSYSFASWVNGTIVFLGFVGIAVVGFLLYKAGETEEKKTQVRRGRKIVKRRKRKRKVKAR